MIAKLLGVLLLIALVAAEPPAIGSTVYDPQGNIVGTIQSIQSDAVVLLVGSDKITLGSSSFRTRDGKLTIGLSRDALEAANAKVQRSGDDDVRPLLIAGAPIYDANGVVAGSVIAVAGDRITIKVETITATFPISAFVKGPKGAQVDGTAADLSARLKASLAAQASSPGATPAAPTAKAAPQTPHQ